MAGEHQFELTAGRLCLDFANTVDNRPAPNRRDYLGGYSDFVSWGRQAGALSASEVKKLLREAAQHPKPASTALRRAKSLRETLFRVFSAVAARRRVALEDLAELKEFAAEVLASSQLQQTRQGFAMENTAPPAQLDRLLVPVTRSALELLLGSDLPLLRQCAAGNCAWLFVDTTKNHRRRWCDARTCGNRAKVRRFRERQAQLRGKP